MFRRTLLKSGPPGFWRPHRISFYRNMQSGPSSPKQEITANISPNRSGGQTSTTPQDKTQSKMDRNLLAHSRDNMSTDDCDSYVIKSITTPEMLSKMESIRDDTRSTRQKEEYEIQSMKHEQDDIRSGQQLIKQKSQELSNKIYNLQYHRDREYVGGVVSMRNQLAHMFLSSMQNAQRKQQVANPIDIRAYVDDQNELAYDVNLLTTINKADLHPAYFDICVDTVFGAPKNLINRLLEWDNTREYQVYRIFGDHGEAWHKAISDNPSPDLEILIQDQKEQVKKAIQEWKEAYTDDRCNYGKKRAECQKIIEEDYRERGLIPRIKENLFHGVKLDQ
ncbi:hypothetical protein BOTCAL_0271g00100 [Botryotinia calthae]|uniref:Uncharacterized protein n=1 Tax=Botryotinia calthae TaxID=38488 RepID=A0A4Y8CVS6_9HELO|nr:hypothetical protein BOTCAL_0271g00100 [Botryotinia calthae]